jgi:YVTN family beta-propeller protein
MHLNCTHLLTVLPSSERRKSNLRTLFALLVIPASVGMFLGAPPAKAQNAYITNIASSTVSVIDTATNTVTTTISGFSSPWGVAVTPNGLKVYVTNLGSNTVSVIDAVTNMVTGSPITVGTEPISAAVTPDSSTVYVTNFGSSNVSVIDTATNMVTATISVGMSPASVVFTPDGSTAYVGNTGSNTVSVIDAVTNMVTGSMIPVGNQPNSFGLFIQPVVLVRFAAFSAKLRSPISSSFRLTGAFTLGADSKGINPVKENVILQIGTFSFTIPSGSFNQAFNGNVRLHRDHRPGELCGPDCADREQEVYLQLYGHRFEFEPGQQGRTWIDRWN